MNSLKPARKQTRNVQMLTLKHISCKFLQFCVLQMIDKLIIRDYVSKCDSFETRVYKK